MDIAILLSTYNGELFLREQLDSILHQTYKNWCLYIRDDGSTDKTIDIIDYYVKKCPEQVIKMEDNAGNLGSGQSFMKMLNDINSEYFMFCDQDDVWLPFKIEITFKKLKEVELDNPKEGVLIYTDLTVVGPDLSLINNSMWTYNKISPENAKSFYQTTCQSSITGCTLMFNNAIKQIALPYPKVALMHDWWLSLNAVHYGIVDYINIPTVLYRQHDNNVLGAKEISKNYYLKRFLLVGRTIKDNIKVLKMLNALNFEVNYSKVFCAKIKVLTKNILSKEK